MQNSGRARIPNQGCGRRKWGVWTRSTARRKRETQVGRRSALGGVGRRHDPAKTRSGDPAIRRSEADAGGATPDPAIRRSGDDPAIRRSGDPAIRRSGDPAIRRSGDPAIRRSGDPAIRRSGDYSEGSPLSPCQPLRETIFRRPGNGRKRCAQRADRMSSFVEDGHRDLSEPVVRLAGAHIEHICRASPVPFGVPYAEPGGKAIARSRLRDTTRGSPVTGDDDASRTTVRLGAGRIARTCRHVGRKTCGGRCGADRAVTCQPCRLRLRNV